ncbi:MAG: NAD(P)-binding domain-containing protein [Flavobacteriia bacterium]|nr:NAD(P)-binding domain-containing protein [Flavobacteriia bacterium]
MIIVVLGAGTMGSGIAQFFAQKNQKVILVDSNKESLIKAKNNIDFSVQQLVNKQKITTQEAGMIMKNLSFSNEISSLANSELVVEAIIENLEIKQQVFKEVENIVSEKCVLCTNTSSLSIASISSCLGRPERFFGMHFFNPATIMPLVELVPSIRTDIEQVKKIKTILEDWGKSPVICKDTPGFIVNRIARPFYGEALRIYEEGIANFETIDFAMTHLGEFKMGPFQLMDYIGNDINYTVSETVFSSFYFDPRFKPSFTQKRYVEAGLLGRKTQHGFYNYKEEVSELEINKDQKLLDEIFFRILAMLINEAYDAYYLKIASREDIELAMTKGVNYPKGLIQWSEEIGVKKIYSTLSQLFSDYGEDRYRPNVMLKRLVNK